MKLSDESRSVVVMVTGPHEKALDHFMNQEFNQEVLPDQNKCLRETVDKAVKEFKHNGYIYYILTISKKVFHSRVIAYHSGNRKLQNSFFNFPELWPTCT